MKERSNLSELIIAANRRTKERDYWLDKFSGEWERCAFLYDYQRTKGSGRAVEIVKDRYSGNLFSDLMKLSANSDVRLHIILVTVLNVLLYKYTGKKDIIVGSPILKPEVEGDFTNTVLALRNRVNETGSFKELLLDVRKTCVEAAENQGYPVEVLIDKLDISYIDDDFPLFDIALLVENIHDKDHLNYAAPNMIFSFFRTAENIDMQLEYNSLLFSGSTAGRIVSHFKRLLHIVPANIDIGIADIDVLSDEERKQLIFDFNSTAAEYPKNKTIHGLFAEQAAGTPDHAAIVGPAVTSLPGAPAPVTLTYRELDIKSGQLARRLIRRGVETGHFIAILADRSLEMLIGILSILKTGCGYVPLNPTAPAERTSYMLTECAARYLLTTSDMSENVKGSIRSGSDELSGPGAEKGGSLSFETIFIDEIAAPGEAASGGQGAFLKNRPLHPGNVAELPEGEAEGFAYVIFTSGSTGKPKGVAVTHANLSPLLHWGFKNLGIGRGDRTIQNLSYYFDWSVWEIFITLNTGACLYPVSSDILLNPSASIDFITGNQITVLHITPTQYRYFVDCGKRIDTLKYLFIGAEKLDYDLTERSLSSVGGNCRVFNMYGPTEATIIAAVLEIDRDKCSDFKGLSSVPIGGPVGNTALYISDKHGMAVPVNVIGELCISGDGIVHGYLNNAELTADRFRYKHIWSYMSHVPYLYRTGDLARRLPDGKIEFIGRIDAQVKIRGFRIELGEIDTRVLEHKDVKSAVVTARQYESGENYLCAYIVLDSGGVDLSANIAADLREFLAGKLPDYMIPNYFVSIEKMPLNPNGKVDTKALPEPDIGASGRRYAAPRDEVEKKLVKIWSRVLGIDSSDSKLGIDDNFLELGGHSLRATRLVYNIHKEFEVDIDLKEVFARPTIRELARKIQKLEQQEYIAIIPGEKKEYYKLSYAQRRLWVLCQFEEDSTAYNMPSAVTLNGSFSVEAFSRAVEILTKRHESLRTIFVLVAGEPHQKILSSEDYKWQPEHVDLRHLAGDEKENKVRKLFAAEANKAFNLEKGPLFSFMLVREEDKKYLLIFNIHHIINDGWSQGTIHNEIVTLFNAAVSSREHHLPPIELQYKDYTSWHNGRNEAGAFNISRQYWLEKFKDKPNGIELPFDHPRRPIQTFNGGMVSFALDEKQTSRLYRLSLGEDATLFMTLLTLLDIFLYKYSGQKDIMIGAPIAGRKRPELYPIIGFLVNTLIYRSRVDPDESFTKLLNRVKQETLSCYEYQDFPFDLLVEELGLDRDLSQSPLFNVMLAHNNADTEDRDLVLEGITVSEYPHREDVNMSKFDLIFFMDERDGRVYIRIEYNSDLFERGAVERMAGNFLALVDDVIKDKDNAIFRLKCTTGAEYETITREFNNNRCRFNSLTIQELFEEQVKNNPERTAVVGIAPDKNLPAITYDNLNREANRLAHYLRQDYHIKPNDVIGVSLDRSIDMIVVLLGIIKSGAGYLAVDPTYPRERVLHVLENSRAELLIIDRMRPELFGNYRGEILDINLQKEKITGFPDDNPKMVNRPGDILYVNYTSGSTGTPNGAMLSHDILTNLIKWQSEKTSVDCSLRCLQFTSINFCVSFQEIAGTLTSGGELHLIGDIERQDIDYLMDFLSEHQIEILFLPFSYLNFLFNESRRWDRSFDHDLKHIITAGEQLKITAGLKRFLDLNPRLELHNHYGSTEMHVVTSYTLKADSADRTPIPPAGKPIDNVCIYILDEYFYPVPTGVYGEIFVKGSSQVLGYINDTALTNKKLIDHPEFSSDGIKLYRSGDIGRWHKDGNIELRGRKDFQVKVRGFRVEPGEIESKILSMEKIRECVVEVKEDAAGQKFLAAYIVAKDLPVLEIKRMLADNLPQYMIPRIILLEKLPLMPNGKVDREKLPEPGMDEAGEYIAPSNEIEEAMADIWSEILQLDKERISVTTNFFELGGHSLKATLIVSKIYQTFDKKIQLVEIFKAPTIREIAALIAKTEKGDFVDLENVPDSDYYELSYNQKRLYVINQMDPESPAFHMPGNVALDHEVDETIIEEVIHKLAARHESLRTGFKIVDHEPVQFITGEVNIRFRKVDISALSEEKRKNERDKVFAALIKEPFDLSSPPLFRAALVKLQDLQFELMFNLHHIITDGWSMGILKRDFNRFYDGYKRGGEPEMEPLPHRCIDFAAWNNKLIHDQEGRKAPHRFWLEKIERGIAAVELPVDVRGNVEDRRGAAYRYRISNAIKERLKKAAEANNTSLFVVLFSAYVFLISRFSSRENITVSIIGAGREHVTLQNIIGFFVNSIPFSITVDNQSKISDFLQTVHREVIGYFQHQAYPIELVYDELNMRYPDINISFNMFNIQDATNELELTTFEPFHIKEAQDVKFDIEPYVIEYKNGIDMRWTYKRGLFKPETIEFIANEFSRIIEFFCSENQAILQGFGKKKKKKSFKKKNEP